MSLFVGSTEFSGAYVGSSAVDAIYLGSTKVWPLAQTYTGNVRYDSVFNINTSSDDTATFSSMINNTTLPPSSSWSNRGVIWTSKTMRNWWWTDDQIQALNLTTSSISTIRKLKIHAYGWAQGVGSDFPNMRLQQLDASFNVVKGYQDISVQTGTTYLDYRFFKREYDMLADGAVTLTNKKAFIASGCLQQLVLGAVDNDAGDDTNNAGIQTMTVELDFDYTP